MERAERRFQPGDSISTIFRVENGRARVKSATQVTLLRFEEETASGSLPDYLENANQARKSPKAVAAEVGLDKHTMGRVYDLLGIPRLPVGEYIKAKWKDPSFRGAIAEANRGHMLRRWQDPEYREFMEGVNADPKSTTAKEESARREMNRRWANTQWREKMQKAQERRWTDEARAEKSEEMKAKWEDPTYRDPLLELRQSEGYRQRLGQSISAKMASDPDYRATAIAAVRDPEAMRKAREATIERWRDPNFRIRMSEAARIQLAAQRQDPTFNELNSRAVSQMMQERWQTQEFREKMQSIVEEMWQDPSHRELVSLSGQLLWLDVDRRIRMLQGSLSSIHGNRGDIDFYALSTWEANFARVLKLTGRDFYTRELFTLNVVPEFADIFKAATTTMAADFITVDSEGRIVLYEIMVDYLKDPVGWAKLNMLIQQHPDLDIRAITSEDYDELEQDFAEQINVTAEFSGWETQKDNLYTNPEKYQ